MLAIVIGTWAGWALDRWLGHQPVVLLPLLPVRPGCGRAQRLPDGGEVPEVNLKTGYWKPTLETDPSSAAVERNAFVIGAAMTVAALFVPPRPRLAIGVAAGAFLVGFSYWTLKRGVTMLAALVAEDPGRGPENPRQRRARTRGNWCCGTLYSLFWRTL